MDSRINFQQILELNTSEFEKQIFTTINFVYNPLSESIHCKNPWCQFSDSFLSYPTMLNVAPEWI